MARTAEQQTARVDALDAFTGGTSADADALFRSVADSTPVMLWMASADAQCTFVNRQWLTFTGRTLEQELGSGWMDGIHPDDLPRVRERVVEAMQSNRPLTIEYRLRRADGLYRWVVDAVSPRSDSRGALIGFVGSTVDLTEHKEEAVETHQRIRDSQEQMRRLAARIQAAREEERTALARELHDELGQTLTAIKLDLGRATSALRDARVSSTVVDRLQSLIGLVEIGIETVKRITTSLRPATLDHLGLPEAIRWEAMGFRARTGLRCHVRADKESTALNPEQQTALFRIFQEALTNVVRHARASAVHVTLAERRGVFDLRIRDNGRGVTDEEVADPRAVGVLGMRERAVLVGGTFTMTGRRGKGTTVLVRVPLTMKRTRRGAPRPGRTRRRQQR
jgi:PAS domain S-box-containing protein